MRSSRLALVRRFSLFVALLAVLASVHAVSAPRAAAGTEASAPRSPRKVEAARTLRVEHRLARGEAPTTLASARGDLLAFPPAGDAPAAPLAIVYLHGRDGLASRGCPVMKEGAAHLGWLVCPTGLLTDARGLSSWGDDLRAQEGAVEAAARAAAESGANGDRVIVGFSQGAYVAQDLLKTGRLRARALVLLGADVRLDPARLRDAGVARVAIGAGQRDPVFTQAQGEVTRLTSLGVDARFVDLGRVGHSYRGESPAALTDAIAWAGGAAR